MKVYQCCPKYGDFEAIVLANSRKECIKKLKHEICSINPEWEEYDFENGFNINEICCDVFISGDTSY